MIRGSRPGKPDRNGLPELSRRYVYRGRKRGPTPQEAADDQAAQRWADEVASGRLKAPAAYRPEHVSRETPPEQADECPVCHDTYTDLTLHLALNYKGCRPEETKSPPGGIPSIGIDQEVSKANYLG